MEKFMDDDDEIKQYNWESGYDKVLETGALDALEDENGLLKGNIENLLHERRRKVAPDARSLERKRLSMMRQVFVLLDCSEAMSSSDFKPNRFMCTLKLLQTFVQEFQTSNPIGQVALVALKGKRGELLSEMSANARLHCLALQSLEKYTVRDDLSLVNGLEIALRTLRLTPSCISREIIVIQAAISTCDPGDINEIFKELKTLGIRFSVITLSAEVTVLAKATIETGGKYVAPLHEAHFRDLLLEHVDPPVATERLEEKAVRMGFPCGSHKPGRRAKISMCMCHLTNKFEPKKLNATGHYCPRCLSKYCVLPVECQTCNLMLITAPHIGRSYFHLFPVSPFQEMEYNGQAALCFACMKKFSMLDKFMVYRCPFCSQHFCNDCDIFIHESLHSCVGCSTRPQVFRKMISNDLLNSDEVLSWLKCRTEIDRRIMKRVYKTLKVDAAKKSSGKRKTKKKKKKINGVLKQNKNQDEKNNIYKMLNMQQLQSVAFIRPDERPSKKKELLEKARQSGNRIKQVIMQQKKQPVIDIREEEEKEKMGNESI